jgi:EH_Signature domain
LSVFKAAIRALRTRRASALALPEVSLTARAAERIVSPVSSSEGPKPSLDYNVVAAEIMTKAAATGALTRREARQAAWCLWETDPALASSSRTMASLVKATETSGTKQPFRTLASSYMTSYAPDRKAIGTISALLVRHAHRMGKPWAPLQHDFNLFHVVEGPRNLARIAVERGTSPTEVLSAYGLGAVNAQSGFARYCIAKALEAMRDGQEPRHDVRLRWVKTFALRNERELLFQEHGPLVTDALLIPFGDTAPAEAVTDRFSEILLRLFGDPRLQPARWARMRAAAAIVRRWLTKQSLTQFLEVVDQIAVDRMWKHRRAFWGAVYDQGLILDAWVVFGPKGADVARRAFGKDISFATFSGIVAAGHAVLLLRIGQGVVAEWSHNGRCIIWSDAQARGAPALHAPAYDVAALRASKATSKPTASVFAIAHSRPESYHWQTRVAEKLEQMTGVGIDQSRYRVS